MATAPDSSEQFCLVTIGATVGFRTLVGEVVHPEFWRFLRSKGFTHLRVQCGPDVPWASLRLASFHDEAPKGLEIQVFETSRNLMREEMTLCQAKKGIRRQGLIISHAGTGTILDAWKLGLSVIVVPNTDLLNDHQTELARYLSKEGYATQSTASRRDLQGAIHKSELLREDNKARWPAHNPYSKTSTRLSLWEALPTEVQQEEKTKMSHD